MEKLINHKDVVKYLTNYKELLTKTNEKDSIDELKAKANDVGELIRLIKRIDDVDKNTIFNQTYIDAFALKQALENFGNPIEGVEINPVWIDKRNLHLVEPGYPDSFEMIIKYSRYAMNPNGFHVGYEDVVFKMKLYDRNSIELYNYPTYLSHLVAIPSVSQLTIIETDFPPEELPDFDSHEFNCSTLNREEDEPDWNPIDDPFPDDCDCGCNDNWEGYSHPDEDFIFQDMDHIFYLLLNYHLNQIPEAEFNPDTRTWELGERSYTVGTPIEDNYWWLG
jgi:hypothetical protein